MSSNINIFTYTEECQKEIKVAENNRSIETKFIGDVLTYSDDNKTQIGSFTCFKFKRESPIGIKHCRKR